MRAPDFYRHFEEGFNAQNVPLGLRKMGGKTPKWKIQVGDYALEFKVATDSRGAGLLALLLWPGEHRMHVTWITGRGKDRKQSSVSLFQYTTDEEVAGFAALNQGSLRKYLAAGGPDPYGTLKEYATTDLGVPKPNIDTFYYFFDADDARGWGSWYGSVLGPWIGRFAERPESHEDWAWRVLWPDHIRPGVKG